MEETQKLKQLMDEKGVTTNEVARMCEVSWQTVNRWRRGQHKPSHIYRKLLKKAIKKLREVDQ